MEVDFELPVDDLALLCRHQHPLVQIFVLEMRPSIFIVKLFIVVAEVYSFVVGHVDLPRVAVVLLLCFHLASLLVAADLVQLVQRVRFLLSEVRLATLFMVFSSISHLNKK